MTRTPKSPFVWQLLALSLVALLAGCKEKKCEDGQVLEGDACVLCPNGTSRFGDETECVPCARGTVSVATRAYCTECEDGSEPTADGLSCQQCTPGTARVAGSAFCEACGPTSISTAIGARECTPCEAGQVASADRLSCVLCPNGTSRFGEETECVPCARGTVSVATRAYCIECEDGSEPTADGLSCQQCTPGTARVAGSAFCEACGPTSISTAVGSRECTPCEDGQVASADRLSCVLCPNGTSRFGEETECVPCARGTVSVATRAYCTECEDGSEPTADGLRCQQCTPGTARVAGSAFCEACGPTSISTTMGARECTPCEDGQVASADRLSCELCPAGSSRFGLETACIRCAPGTISVPTRAYCIECEAGGIASEDGTSCSPAPGDVDAPCVDGDIDFADAPGMSREVLFDSATNAFVLTEGARVRRVDEDGTSTTILDTTTLGARRIALLGDYVVAHQGFDFFAPNEMLRHSRIDATNSFDATMQTISPFGSVTAPIRIFDIWQISETEGAFFNAGNSEIGVFDVTSAPFRMGRSGELAFEPNLTAAFGAENTLFLGILNPDNTGKLVAMDISEGAPGFDDGFLPDHEWTLPGFIQSMEIDRTTNTLYVTIGLPHGTAAIDLDNPDAEVIFQLNVPGEERGFQVLSRPVVGENFVAVVSQDNFAYTRVTVYEPVTLRRIGYLIDEDRESPFEDADGNNAGAFAAARGTTLWASRGDGTESDMLIDIGVCLP